MKKCILFIMFLYVMAPVCSFAQYSNASLTGPWILINANNLYVIFDGNGIVNEIGSASDSLIPVGRDSVTLVGAITGVLNLTDATKTFTGQILSDTTAVLQFDSAQTTSPLIRISNPASLVGTWNGSVYDSSTLATLYVQLSVNNSGVITSASGVSLLAGKMFQSNDTFVGYITTNDTNCINKYFRLSGYYSGDSLTGDVLLGKHDGNACGDNGSFTLTRTTTAIAAIDPVFDFSVYPNPFTDQVEIAINTPGNRLRADMMDMCGKKVYSAQWGSIASINLNMGTLSNGMYLLTLTSDNKTITKRILKN